VADVLACGGRPVAVGLEQAAPGEPERAPVRVGHEQPADRRVAGESVDEPVGRVAQLVADAVGDRGQPEREDDVARGELDA
jgi:hypothetical protein